MRSDEGLEKGSRHERLRGIMKNQGPKVNTTPRGLSEFYRNYPENHVFPLLVQKALASVKRKECRRLVATHRPAA